MKIYRAASRHNISDYNSLMELFYKGTERVGLKTIILGDVCGQPILLASPINPNSNLKNLLVVAGIHGEEPAGCWATIQFILKENPELFSMVNISILPVFNPSGFISRSRNNTKGERTNVFIGNPSEEGKLIISKSDLLSKLGSDCVLSLHENITVKDEFYLYANTDETEGYDDGSAKSPFRLGGITADLLEIAIQRGLTRFKIREDGVYKDDQGVEGDEYEIEGGIITNLKDGSFEDYMNRIKGCPVVILPETPCDGQAIKNRIDTHLDIIKGIAHYLAIDLSKDCCNPLIIPVPIAKQTTHNSCGGASLNSALRYYGLNKTEKQINDLCEVSNNGIEPEKIVEVAQKFGLKSRLIKGCSIDELKNMVGNGIPVIIAIVAWGGQHNEKDYNDDESGHYVVVIGFDKARVYIEDPSIINGRGFMDWFEFEHRWHDVDGKNLAIPIQGNKKAHFEKANSKIFRIP